MNTILKKISSILLIILTSFHINAQDISYEQWDFGNFSINLPEKCIENTIEDNPGISIINTDLKFLFYVCYFKIDEDYVLKEGLQDEANNLGLNLDEIGYFAITTGTTEPLLCTGVEYDNYDLLFGIYPDYDNEQGIFIATSSGLKNLDLMLILSSFRFKKPSTE